VGLTCPGSPWGVSHNPPRRAPPNPSLRFGVRVRESGPLRAVHLSRHKWPICCPLSWRVEGKGLRLRGTLPARERPCLLWLFFSSSLLSSLELSDTKVYAPEIRARLGTATHLCKAVVLKLETVPISASLGSTDYSQVDILGLRYEPVYFGAGKKLGPLNWRGRRDRD